MKIYKFKMDDDCMNGWFKLEMPIGSEFLSFQEQEGFVDGMWVKSLFAWFKVDGNAALCQREFILAGTGIDFEELRIKPSDKFLGTAQNGGYVWHLFERIE